MSNQKAEHDLLNSLIKLSREVSHGRYGNPEQIFELTKTGTYPKPITDLAESFGMMIVKVEAREFHLQETIEKLKKSNKELQSAQKKLSRENSMLKDDLRKKFSRNSIKGQSKVIKEILSLVDRLADTSVNILITGETGTGKELIAKAFHYQSSRNRGPFVALNCSALPEKLIESELFGIEKGVATGVERRIGKIEQAHGGTLFLDEIGDMPLSTQTKMLRVLQDFEIERIGGRKTIPVDLRIIAATNKDLKGAIADKSFREDLYYRLNVANINLPPLRDRKEDIPLLLKTFLTTYATKYNRTTLSFSTSVIKDLKEYPWPGNVRELENEVERAVALALSDTISHDDFSEDLQEWFGNRADRTDAPDSLKDIEIRKIQDVLKDTKGNKSEAARRLGLSREGFRKKLQRYGLS